MSKEKVNLSVARLRCCGLEEPMGISAEEIDFSWQIEGEGSGVNQLGYTLQLAREETDFESGEILYENTVSGSQTYAIPLQWSGLTEKTRYCWRVRPEVETASAGRLRLPYSAPAFFETGLAGESSWRAKWIEAGEEYYRLADRQCRGYWQEEALGDADQGLRRPPLFRCRYQLDGVPERARAYVTARGLYQIYINGQKVGEDVLTPDFTPYEHLLFYQTYDVTGFLREGENDISAAMGDGWFIGHAQANPGENHLFGTRPALLLQIELSYRGGGITYWCSDSSWGAEMGPLQYADFMMGERYETQYENEPVTGFETVERDYPLAILKPQQGRPVGITETLAADAVYRLADGGQVIDFGQCIAGRSRLCLRGLAGEVVTVCHSELVDEAGDLVDLLARFPFHAQKNTIVFHRDMTLIYEPQFSFQGFRYVKVIGHSLPLERQDCTAQVLGTPMERRIRFQCSDERLNRLVENGIWSQRGNMLSIPTDCPQRERAGFTGDIQVYGRTAGMNADADRFLRRWLGYCRMEQLPGGQIPMVIPYTNAYRRMEPCPGWTSAGWSDVIIFLPWELYGVYGDKRLLRDNYAAMLGFMEYVGRCAAETMPERYYADFAGQYHQRYLWNTGFHWGDWLMPGMSGEEGLLVTREITASIFYYRMAETMRKIARLLGEEQDASRFEGLTENIRAAFTREYIVEETRLLHEYQGLYVMALAFGMVTGKVGERFARRLDTMVRENEYHLQTGFLSTPYLLDVLWDNGYRDTACRLLYQTTPPSWLYEVEQGATTVWEEWEPVAPDGSVRSTSFNHYAFGCVADFIYRRIGGLQNAGPGFERAVISPEMTGGLSHARIEYETVHGVIRIEWEKSQEGLAIDLTVPHNMAVECRSEGEGKEKILGSGKHRILYRLS